MKKPKEEYIHLIPEIKTWLGKDGISFFIKLKEEYGKIDAIWMEYGIPHVVHFREGMQIRNRLRTITQGAWTAHEYDETWIDIVEECIKE